MTLEMPSGPPESKRPDHELVLRFVNGSSDRFVADELVRFVMKRQMFLALIFFALLLSVIAPVPIRGGLSHPAFAAATLVHFLLYPVIFLGIVQLVAVVARREGRVTVVEPIVSLSTTFVVSQAGRVVGSLVDGELYVSRTGVLVDFAVHYVVWQALTLVFFVFVVPGQRKRQKIQQAEVVEFQRPMFRMGRLALDPDCIRHIEADDHYLVIRAGKVDLRVLGRLSEAASQLEAQGMIVHRSHWVAFSEFGPVTRKGRTFQMTAPSGRQVPVSREKWREVREVAERERKAA